MEWSKVFCANCGCDGGMATSGTTHIFYLCDACVFLHGPPAGCHEVKAQEISEDAATAMASASPASILNR
jgi:hypothetical protein